MKTTKLPGGASVKWSGEELYKSARAELFKKLLTAAAYVRSLAVKNVSVSSRSGGPSRPGEYPHADTGRLRNSIFDDADEADLSAIVGTNLKYGLYMEFGTAGPRTVEAAGGKLLSWVDREGKRRFARRVTIPAMPARSYLRRSLREAEPKLRALFAEQYKDLKAG